MRWKLLAGPLLVALTGCRNVAPAGVYLASDPPGARVLLDGRYAGHVTPCMIDLDQEEEYRVTFELDGYAPREVVLQPNHAVSVVGWDSGRLSNSGTDGALWLESDVLFAPYRIDDSHSPNRVFVQLRPASVQ